MAAEMKNGIVEIMFQFLDSPRSAMKSVVDGAPTWSFFLFASVWGIWKNLSQLLRFRIPRDTDVGPTTIIVTNIVFGAPFGISVLFLFALLVYCVARLAKTRPTVRSVSITLAWSSLPQVVSVVLLLLLFVMTGDELIYGSLSPRSNLSPLTYFSGMICTLLCGILSLCSLVLAVIGLSEAAHASVARSVAVYCVSGLVAFGVVLGAIAGWAKLWPQ